MTDPAPCATGLQISILQALDSATVTCESLHNATHYATPVELMVLTELQKNAATVKYHLQTLIGAVGDPRVTSISDIENIPIRTRNLLIGAGVITMEKAQALDEKLLDIDGFGHKALAQVRAWKKA